MNPIFSKKYLAKKHKERREKTPEQLLWYWAKARAKAKGLDFDIDVEDIIIPQFCPLLNIPLRTSDVKRSPNTPSLDRIRNHLGYVKGNILVVSWRANKIKADATIDELELLLTNLKTIY